MQQPIAHAIDVGHDVVIGKADDLIAKRSQVLVSRSVVRRDVGVAVDLDYHGLLGAQEVGDERAYDGLAAELVTVELGAGDFRPQAHFWFGRVFAHIFGVKRQLVETPG